jgi:hypothetical protein
MGHINANIGLWFNCHTRTVWLPGLTHGPTLTGQVLHPPEKSDRPHFWNS